MEQVRVPVPTPLASEVDAHSHLPAGTPYLAAVSVLVELRRNCNQGAVINPVQSPRLCGIAAGSANKVPNHSVQHVASEECNP